MRLETSISEEVQRLPRSIIETSNSGVESTDRHHHHAWSVGLGARRWDADALGDRGAQTIIGWPCTWLATRYRRWPGRRSSRQWWRQL